MMKEQQATSQEKDVGKLYNDFVDYHIDCYRTNRVGNPNAYDYLEFPIKWDKERPIDEFLFYLYKRYYQDLQDFVKKLEDGKEVDEKGTEEENKAIKIEMLKETIDKVQNICNTIIKIIRCSMSGKSLLVENKLKELMPYLALHNFIMNIEDFDTQTYYRLRDTKDLISEKDFYHMPFDLIHKCSSTRFSVAGTPCLYLGCSKEVCVAELGTNIGSMAEFKLKQSEQSKSLKVIDLTFYEQLNGRGNEHVNMFLLWPMLAACYIVEVGGEKEKNIPFREEYIFPQLLTSYFSKIKGTDDIDGADDLDDIDGIRYYSCRNVDLDPRKLTYMNLALFVHRSVGGEFQDDWELNCDIKNTLLQIDKYDEDLMEHFEYVKSYNL